MISPYPEAPRRPEERFGRVSKADKWVREKLVTKRDGKLCIEVFVHRGSGCSGMKSIPLTDLGIGDVDMERLEEMFKEF